MIIGFFVGFTLGVIFHRPVILAKNLTLKLIEKALEE